MKNKNKINSVAQNDHQMWPELNIPDSINIVGMP